MDSSDWSNVIRHHTLDTRSDTEFKLSVDVGGTLTTPSDFLEIEGQFTEGLRPGRSVRESVGGIFEMDSAEWSNGVRYHVFDIRSDTEFNLCVGVTCNADLLEIVGQFTQESQPGRSFGASVGGISEMGSCDLLNGIRHHIFDTRPDTEFKKLDWRVQSTGTVHCSTPGLNCDYSRPDTVKIMIRLDRPTEKTD